MISATVRAEMRRLVLGEKWLIRTVARRFGVHHSVVRRAVYDDHHGFHREVSSSITSSLPPHPGFSWRTETPRFWKIVSTGRRKPGYSNARIGAAISAMEALPCAGV